LKSASEVV